MFANNYLQKNSNATLIPTKPRSNTGIIVVIPCFREPDILKTLESINSCLMPKVHVEVVVLINHSEAQNEDTKEYNRETKIEIDKWIDKNKNTGICFFAPGPIELKKKWAGAGLARKSGMDEAVRRFNFLNKPNGLIVSLDADTVVELNYLVEIEKHFKLNPKHVGATIAFQHQKENLNARQLEGINLYEKYLDYYKEALCFSGYPYSMFTIGSAFVVSALAYVKRGGMNRRQAGEDFYFLQNLVQIGVVGEIKSTCVYPSARLSDRVPFGTGPILQKWMNGQEDLNLSYNFKSFTDLKEWFSSAHKLYKIGKIEYEVILNKLPNSIASFLKHDNFWDELDELNKNCSKPETFEVRFFHKFNAFKILKYLNFSEERFYEKADLKEQVVLLNQEQQT
jgi:hypothetical protein